MKTKIIGALLFITIMPITPLVLVVASIFVGSNM